MFLDGCFSPQLRPEANSIWEDGRLYELAVESTVPVPCPGEVAPPAGAHCALTLELATSGEGEGGGSAESPVRAGSSLSPFSCRLLWKVEEACRRQTCLCPPAWCTCLRCPAGTASAAEPSSTSAPSRTLSATGTGRLGSLLLPSAPRVSCGTDTRQNLPR